MKLFFICLFCIVFFTTSFSQDVNSLLKEAERLEFVPNENAAFFGFKEVLKLQPTNLYALCKAAEICSNIGNRETNTKNRDAYFATALVYAKTAYKLYPESDAANVVMAITQGRVILLKSGKEKIIAVKELKMYAEKAIAINPNNFKAWHILGKWHYEMSNLNTFEKTAAKLFFGALPVSSLSTSIACYEKAKILNTGFSLNYLELAKAYKRNGEKLKAITQINYLLNLKNITEDDVKIKQEARTLLNRWS